MNEEQKAIQRLDNIRNDMSLSSEDLHYANILYHLIQNQIKRIDELENHIHYKKCIACGKEFKSKRKDAKYCVYCSKYMNNRNYYLNLTDEQKQKRREQAKLSMKKIRAKRKMDLGGNNE